MNVYEKLLSVRQSFLKADIKKSGRNQFGGFSYFELADLIPAITKFCGEVKAVTTVDFRGGTAVMRFIDMEKPEDYIEASFELVEMEKVAKMNAIQRTGSVQTYARRYLYMIMFDIVEADAFDLKQGAPPEEADGSAGRTQKPGKAQKPAAKPKPDNAAGLSDSNKAMIKKLLRSIATSENVKPSMILMRLTEHIGKTFEDITDEEAPGIFKILEGWATEAAGAV